MNSDEALIQDLRYYLVTQDLDLCHLLDDVERAADRLEQLLAELQRTDNDDRGVL